MLFLLHLGISPPFAMFLPFVMLLPFATLLPFVTLPSFVTSQPSGTKIYIKSCRNAMLPPFVTLPPFAMLLPWNCGKNCSDTAGL